MIAVITVTSTFNHKPFFTIYSGALAFCLPLAAALTREAKRGGPRREVTGSCNFYGVGRGPSGHCGCLGGSQKLAVLKRGIVLT